MSKQEHERPSYRSGAGSFPDLCFRGIWMVIHPPASPSRIAEQHYWHEWVLVTEGLYRVRVEGKLLELRPGRSVLLPQGCMHQALPENHCRLLVLQWEGERSAPVDSRVLPDTDGRFQDLFTWMWRVWMRQEPWAAECLDAQILALLLSLSPEKGASSNWVEDVELYLRNAEHKHLDLNELERAFGRSPRHISRAFKERYKCSPIAYYRTIRAEHALRRLRSSMDSVAAVSRELGYSSASAMYRDLKRQYGLGPQQLRKMDSMSLNDMK